MNINNKKNQKITAQHDTSVSVSPVLRFSHLVIAAAFVLLIITMPMFMVWKQIKVTNIAVRESALSDTLSVLSKEIASLRLYNEHLASTERIETIMRANRGLDYPSSQQIVVVREGNSASVAASSHSNFMAILKKTFTRERT
jgi:cell division protein FtsL